MGLDLIPRPRSVTVAAGVCLVGADAEINLQANDPRLERAVLDWRSACADRGPGKSRRAPEEACTDIPDGDARPRIRIVVDRTAVQHRDGYRLTVRRGGIDIVGGSAAGCFHAIQTLWQLSSCGGGSIRYGGPNFHVSGRPPVIAVPCCTVIDWPDYTTRGLLHDVTRGKVPKLDTLLLLADHLAQLKANQLQLYIEHAFVFSFDPDICGPGEGLTPDEVGELDRYCHERFIDLVPALATLGHMGRILSMPRYRRLAEVEAAEPWSAMTWPRRVRGLTLNCTDPAAHRLMEHMWSDVLDAFSSPVVNICGDEPYDLGRGGTADHNGLAYIEHIRRTHDFCAARGRRTQFWSDVARNYPNLLDRLPGDSTVLHWGYDDRADYDGTASFVNAGLNTFVCPGTTGWKRIINAMNLAERNITTFAKAGIKHGATGLLNTDWGDHGHFNLLACSWHGIALGAATAWDADHPTGEVFDRLFARQILRVDHPEVVSQLRAASRLADRCETWRLLWMPIAEIMEDPTLPSYEDLTAAHRAAQDAACSLERLASTARPNAADPRDLQELSIACRFSELLAEKLIYIHDACENQSRDSDGANPIRPNPSPDRKGADRQVWADRLLESAAIYADCWHARNKPSGLQDIQRALTSAARNLRAGTPKCP